MDASNVLTLSLKSPAELAEEDRALVAAAQKDTNAAGQLFDKHYPEIFRYIYHSTHDHTVTEDLTFERFLFGVPAAGLVPMAADSVSGLALPDCHQRNPHALPPAKAPAGGVRRAGGR